MENVHCSCSNLIRDRENLEKYTVMCPRRRFGRVDVGTIKFFI
jgi:hypothetical protein